MNRKLGWEEITGILFFMAGAGMLGVSVFLSFSSDLWYDEVFTMGLAGQSLKGLVSTTARDVHPPLYYIIVKLFLLLFPSVAGEGQVIITKLVSVFPFFLCLIYSAVKVRKHFGMLSAGIFAFLLLTMPQMADYTVEMRMYGYALFFLTAGMLHAYELTISRDKGRKDYINWIALTFYGLAACYTHYFACVGACMIYLYVLLFFCKEGRIERKWKEFLVSGFVCVAGYLPWLVSAVTFQVGQVKENYWIQPLSWRSLGGCAKFIFQPFFLDEKLNMFLAAVLFLLYGILLITTVVKWIREKQKAQEKLFFVMGAVGVLVGIVVFGFLASFLIRPVFVYRYMMPALGLFWLAFGILAAEQKNKKIILFPMLGALLFIGLWNYRSFYGEEMWKRVQMAKAWEAIANIEKEDIVVYNFDQTQAVISYYLPCDSYLWYGTPEALIQEMYPTVHPLVEGEFTDEKGIAQLRELLDEKEHIWFLGSGNARDEIIEKWKKAGISVWEKADVMVERYWFKIYECTKK